MSKNKSVDALLESAGSSLDEHQNYDEALTFLAEAETLLPEDDLKSWASFYSTKCFCLYKLGELDEEEQLSYKALDHLKRTEIAATPDYDGVRRTLRSCSNAIAMAIMGRAEELEELLPAIPYNRAAFETFAPHENQDEWLYDEFYAVRAEIYAKAAEMDEKYMPQAFEALKEYIYFTNYGYEVDYSVELIAQSDAFIDYLDNDPENPLTEYRKGPPGETLEQAFERLSNYSAYVKGSDFSQSTTEPEAETEENIATIEKHLGFSLSPCLKNFYRKQADFSLEYRSYYFSIFSTSALLKILTGQRFSKLKSIGLIDIILESWGYDRHEFDTLMKPEVRQKINENYFSFGYCRIDDNAHWYLYFDRNGNFGYVFYDQNLYNRFIKEEITPMLETSPAHLTLDNTIIKIIDHMINDDRCLF